MTGALGRRYRRQRRRRRDDRRRGGTLHDLRGPQLRARSRRQQQRHRRCGDPGQNVVSVYYDLDEVGNDPVNPGSVEHPDGVADKYQLVVSYEAINGTINGIPRVVLDKFDADGNHAVDGTAVLDAGQIPGTAPSVGFGPEGTWAPMAPIADMQLTENTDFVITYAATPVEPTNPDNPDEPNPACDATD